MEDSIILGFLISILLPFIQFLILTTNLISKTEVVKKYVIFSNIFNTFISIVIFVAFYKITDSKNDNKFLTNEVDWINVGSEFSVQFGILLDNVSILFSIVLNIISLLITYYSFHYLKDEPKIKRYFSHLGLFQTSMLGLVISINLLQFFVFWEFVGLSSYLLIGFWYKNPINTFSATKAILYNKIGDVCLLIGIVLLVWSFNNDITFFLLANTDKQIESVTSIGITLLFISAFIKSAQFPFYSWLPDAMTGPTPISALLHAATMVVSGVILLMRILPILDLHKLELLMLVSSLTAFWSAILACFESDIKKVLAYSTISQLGFMFVGLAVGGKNIALFHLITHAFFKCLLFLCVAEIQLWLKKKSIPLNDFSLESIRNINIDLPIVKLCYLIAAISLIGLPFTCGFLSKEIILGSLISNLFKYNSVINFISVIFVFLSIILTAIYITKHYLNLFGKNGIFNFKLNQSKFKSNYIFIILSMCCMWVFYSPLNPFTPTNNVLLDLNIDIVEYSEIKLHDLLPIFVILLSVFGIVIGYFIYKINVLKFSKLKESMINPIIDVWFINRLLFFFILVSKFENYILDRIILKIGSMQAMYKIGHVNYAPSNIISIIDEKVFDHFVNYIAIFLNRMSELFSSLLKEKLLGYYIFGLFFILVILLNFIFLS